MNSNLEHYVHKKVTYDKIPKNSEFTQLTQREYEKFIINYSISNQLEYKGNLVQYIKDKSIKLTEKKYYEELIKYSKENLMLYPYHLAEIIVKGLDITPFQYYYTVLEFIMESEKSYDSLPNFTAADCLRLMGIGRNEYIDLMNKFISSSKLFRRKKIKSLLPNQPVVINIEPWWNVEIGYIIEEDMKNVSVEEKELVDRIIDFGKQKAGDLDYKVVMDMYLKGLIYLEVPIEEDDHVILPPLEGFVMTRVQGDYFENLLYKIFVSIDERTSVGELASVLQIDVQSVQNVVSLYCRLGFAIKKVPEMMELHPSWEKKMSIKSKGSSSVLNTPNLAPLIFDVNSKTSIIDSKTTNNSLSTPINEYAGALLISPSKEKRMAFLFDSTLTAFLMMGNLSPGLKSHAVTMFEVGKLSDESVESFLTELEKVSTVRDDSEGEAKRYFEHALILRETILTLRYHENNFTALDLVRCESLEPLDRDTTFRLLNKNYSLLVSMAPLCKEVTPITSITPPHLGPAHSEVNTFWFKLFLYSLIQTGPPSVLFVKGTRLRRLPQILLNCSKLLVTSWGHDPLLIPMHNSIFTINDALLYAPVFVQAYGWKDDPELKIVPFPFKDKVHQHVELLSKQLDMKHNCGYVTLLKNSFVEENDSPFYLALPSVQKTILNIEQEPSNGKLSKENETLLREELAHLTTSGSKNIPNESSESDDWILVDCCFGVPLFDHETNHYICEAIINNNLWGSESLEELTKSNEVLRTKLTNFIRDIQECPSQHTHYNKIKQDSDIMRWPKRNLMFSNGKVSDWDSK